MLGTKAEPEFLAELPRERLIAALDEKGGEVVVEGWTKGTGRRIEERMAGPRALCLGLPRHLRRRRGQPRRHRPRAREAIETAKGLHMTQLVRKEMIVRRASRAAHHLRWRRRRSAGKSAQLDRLGADVQAGTAIALGKLTLAEAFAASLSSDRPDGLWPTVVCDEGGRALGLVWSDLESLTAAIETGRGAYRSRSRGLWVKGESSGDVQDLIRVEADCDRDAIRFTVRQNGRGFCHLARRSCFDDGSGIERLERTLMSRKAEAPAGSYTRKLFDDPGLLASKLREEADELNRAKGPEEATRRSRRRHLLRAHEGDRRGLEPGGDRGRAGPPGPAREPPRRGAEDRLRPGRRRTRHGARCAETAAALRRIRLEELPEARSRARDAGGRGGGRAHHRPTWPRAARPPCANGRKSWAGCGRGDPLVIGRAGLEAGPRLACRSGAGRSSSARATACSPSRRPSAPRCATSTWPSPAEGRATSSSPSPARAATPRAADSPCPRARS